MTTETLVNIYFIHLGYFTFYEFYSMRHGIMQTDMELEKWPSAKHLGFQAAENCLRHWEVFYAYLKPQSPPLH